MMGENQVGIPHFMPSKNFEAEKQAFMKHGQQHQRIFDDEEAKGEAGGSDSDFEGEMNSNPDGENDEDSNQEGEYDDSEEEEDEEDSPYANSDN